MRASKKWTTNSLRNEIILDRGKIRYLARTLVCEKSRRNLESTSKHLIYLEVAQKRRSSKYLFVMPVAGRCSALREVGEMLPYHAILIMNKKFTINFYDQPVCVQLGF